MDIIDIYRAFHPRISNHTFFSSAHGIFSKIGLLLGHKTINKFKKIKIISSIFSDPNALWLEVNCKKEVKKPTNLWRLKNILLRMTR